MNTYGHSLKSVQNYFLKINPQTGNRLKKSCCYDSQAIAIDNSISDYQYKRMFPHEYGHFVDDMISEKGYFSSSNDFIGAFEKEEESYSNENDGHRKEMLQALSENESAFSSEYISDILSALTNNNTAVTKFYKANYKARSYHNWYEYGKYENVHRRSDTFANIFAIYSENNPNVTSFAETYFPNLVGVFKEGIKERR